MALHSLLLNFSRKNEENNLYCFLSTDIKKFIARAFFFFIVTVFVASFDLRSALAMEGCGDNANPAVRTICEIIIFLQGRIGRSLVVFIIMLSAWSFVGGNFKWQEMVTLAIGVGIFFNPKTFTLFLLPSYIVGISGDGFDINTKYTPDEILLCYCPELT